MNKKVEKGTCPKCRRKVEKWKKPKALPGERPIILYRCDNCKIAFNEYK